MTDAITADPKLWTELYDAITEGTNRRRIMLARDAVERDILEKARAAWEAERTVTAAT